MSHKALGPAWGSFFRNALLVAVLAGMIYAAFNLRLPPLDELQQRALRLRVLPLGCGRRTHRRHAHHIPDRVVSAGGGCRRP